MSAFMAASGRRPHLRGGRLDAISSVALCFLHGHREMGPLLGHDQRADLVRHLILYCGKRDVMRTSQLHLVTIPPPVRGLA